ncbi:hypothetical protein D3C84_1240440 [compost metagenome]
MLAVRAVRTLDHDPGWRRIVGLRLAQDLAAVAPPLPLQPLGQPQDHHIEEAADQQAEPGRQRITDGGVLI